MHTLSGRVAIVTGAAQGIGRGIALALADAGASIVAAGRTPATLDVVCAEIEARGAKSLAVRCDVCNPDDIQSCIEQTAKSFERLDILINNAQIAHNGLLLDSSDDDMDKTYQSGPLAVFRFMRAAHPLLKVRGGVVINLGSSATLVHDSAGYGPYAAAKSAIEALNRTAAVEWGKDGIRTMLVLPAAETPLTSKMRARDPQRYAMLLDRVPLGRFGDPERDIGRVVTWLVSDEAGYLTGSTIMLDGGQTYLR